MNFRVGSGADLCIGPHIDPHLRDMRSLYVGFRSPTRRYRAETDRTFRVTCSRISFFSINPDRVVFGANSALP